MSTLTIDCDNDITALVKVPADADRSSSGTANRRSRESRAFHSIVIGNSENAVLKMQVPDLPLGSVSLYSSM
jgi:hypothetical protein